MYINYLFSLFGKNLGKTALFKVSEMSGYISFLGCPKCPNKSPARYRVKKLCARIVSLNYFLAVGSLLISLASLSVRGSLGVRFLRASSVVNKCIFRYACTF